MDIENLFIRGHDGKLQQFSSGASSEWTSQQFAVSVHAHTPFSSLSNLSYLDLSPILPDLQAFRLFYAT